MQGDDSVMAPGDTSGSAPASGWTYSASSLTWSSRTSCALVEPDSASIDYSPPPHGSYKSWK